MKAFLRPASVVAIAWSLFQIYMVYGPILDPLVAVPIHVMFAIALTFILRPLLPAGVRNSATSRTVDYMFVLCAAAIAIYFLVNAHRITTRIGGVDPLEPGDYVVGVMALFLVIEATRRALGMGLTVVILVFLVYQFTGTLLRGIPVLNVIAHSGRPSFAFFTNFLDLQVLQNQGIFGIPSVVSYSQVYYFLLFGAVIELCGAGQLFIDLATLLVGRFRGGMAKVAVIASTLFGSISGSATANASVMGMFTIPTMRRSGMSAEEAAAVEAAASTGGQLMPPVMGAAAFLMAQFLGVPYREIAEVGIIPALLYYAALFFFIDATARKKGYRGLTPAEMTATWGKVLKESYLFAPVILLVYEIFVGRALSSATLEASAATLALAFVTRAIRDLRAHGIAGLAYAAGSIVRDGVRALDSGGRAAVAVAIPCAGAGIVVGVATMTNLGLSFGNFVSVLSGGMLLPALLLVMLMVIVMGMGMPTTAAYIMGAVLAIPALEQFHVPLLSAHFFVLYFAVLSMVTPPVALAAFVAGGIAQANLWRTGWLAFRNSLAGFLVPFALIFGPSLMLKGSLGATAVSVGTALVGCYALAAAVVGHLRRPNSLLESFLLLVAAVLLIAPLLWASVGGFALLATIWAWQSVRLKDASAGRPREVSEA